MLRRFEERLVSMIFCLLLLISAVYMIGVIGGTIIMGGFAIRAAIVYVQVARQEWAQGGSVWTQLVDTQRLYRQTVWQIYRNDGAAAYDPEQTFLNTYGGGGERLRDRLVRWGKRIVQLMAALLIWVPAIAVHGAVLLALTAYLWINRWLNEE